MGLFRDFAEKSIDFIREEVLPLRGELVKAGILTPDIGAYDQKASLVDPWSYSQTAYGYKEKWSVLDYSKLRQVSYSDPIVAAVIQTRINQVASFAIPQADRYKVGYKIVLRDREARPSDSDKQKMKELEQFIFNCGVPESFDDTPERRRRDNFDVFLRKIVRDSLTYDQINFEITPRKNGMPYSFVAVDASTIRLIPDTKEWTESHGPGIKNQISSPTQFNYDDIISRQSAFDEFKPKYPKYVQVINGRILHTFDEWELAFGIRNPRTDIISSGYGYCLHPDSRVSTTMGMVKISELSEYRDHFEVVFNGEKIRAIAFKTGKKSIVELHFDDGRIIKASKDHLFYVLNSLGEFEWRKLSEINSGDVVASDIGFLQSHTIPSIHSYKWVKVDVVGESFVKRAASFLNSKDSDCLKKNLVDCSVTRQWLFDRLPDCSVKTDLKWHHGVVSSVVETEEMVEMYDLSVNSDFHAFSVDGVVVHNSEIEMMITTITSHMNAEAYNRKFFTQGSITKGIMAFEGSVPPDQLESFRRQWYQQVTGISNAWRTPIMSLGKDTKLNWIDLHNTNREMEYGKWLDYTIKTICSVYQMDPIEIGFDISKQGSGEKGSSGGLGQGSSQEKIIFFSRKRSKTTFKTYSMHHE